MNNSYSIIVVIILIILVGLLIYFIRKKVNGFQNCRNIEGFGGYLEQEAGTPDAEPENDFKSEGGSFKELKRDTGKIKPATGSCKSNTDPEQLCLTYDSCCEGAGGNNCLCKNPIIKDCVSMYEKCIADEYLSEKNMSYLGNQNKHKVCQNILKNCCGIVKKIKIDAKYQQVNMKYGHSDDELCSVNGSTPEMCRNMCNLNKDCTGYIYQKGINDCYLYSGTFKDKKQAYAKGDKNYLQYVKEGFVSGNGGSNENGSGIDGMSICMNYNQNCSDTGKLSGNVNACICNHSITQDCKNQYDMCLTKEIEGLDGKLKKTYCRNMFGACCQAINNIDVSERFKYEDPVGGNGISSNMICFDENPRLSLDKCQKRCINNPDCTFIDTNTGLTPELRDDDNLYCGLYKGSPGSYSSGTTMKKKTLGKTIYKKKEITEKEKINTELEKE